MRRNFIIKILIMAMAFILLFSFSGLAKDDTEKGEKKAGDQIVVYKPPMRGAPGSRMGGGTRSLTRGADQNLPSLAVLVPDHAGLTTRPQPTLYWYLSAPASNRIEFTLNDEDQGETLIQTALNSAEKSGIQRLNLSDYKISLSPDKLYSWFITMIVNPDKPAGDVSSGGAIRFTSPSEEFREKLSGAAKTDMPGLYAEEGVWYDALSELSELIEANPADKSLREQRAGLFEQIGLHNVAEFDRKIFSK
jgi:hypothetical protein